MQQRASVFHFGGWELDERCSELRFEGEPVEVRAKPLALIAHLLRNRDRFVPAAELLDACWAGVVVSESALHSAVKLARRALREPRGDRSWIVSRRGRGYRFLGEVEVAAGAAAAPPPVVDRAEPPPDDLVGRDALLRELDDALGAALTGSGRTVLLRGEAGIGKTRLLAEVARRAAARGAIAASGWCADDGGGPPFWPWLQILSAVAREAQLPEPDPLVRAERAPADEAPGDERSYRLFDGVTRWLAEAADARGLAVLLDDVHGADASSLGLLAYAARALANSRVLVVVAERDPAGERSAPLTRALAALARLPNGRSLEVGPLTRPAVGALVERIAPGAPAEDVVDGIHERSRGNPFFVAALVRNLDARGLPAALRDALQGRLGRLSRLARALLCAAAVIGREFESATLARAADAPAEEVERALAEAVREGFVEELPDRHRFEHAIVREAILSELPPAEQARLHARVADALAALDPDDGPERIARHYAESGAGAAGRAVEFSERAGRRALRVLAFESAAAHFERALAALALGPSPDPARRAELLLALARAYAGAGASSKKVRRAALDAAELARDRGDHELLARAALALDDVAFSFPMPDVEIVALLEAALAARAGREDGVTVRLLCRLAHELLPTLSSVDAGALAVLERHGHPDRYIERAARIAEQLDEPAPLATARWAQVQSAAATPSLSRRARLAEEAAALAERAGLGGIAALAHWQSFFARLALGESGLGAQVVAFAVRVAASPLALGRPLLLQQRATLALLEGELERAERDLREGQRLELHMQARGLVAAFAFGRLLCSRERGDGAEYRDRAARFQALPTQRIARIVLADCELLLGDHDAARAALAPLLAEGVDALPRDDRGPVLRGWLAELAHALGDRALAAALLPDLAAIADQQVVGFIGGACLGSVARYAGLAAQAAGDLRAAAGYFERALEANARSGALLFRAHAQVDLARLLHASRRADERERAAGLLDQADAFAEGRPLGALRARIRSARLEARGIRTLPRRRA